MTAPIAPTGARGDSLHDDGLTSPGALALSDAYLDTVAARTPSPGDELAGTLTAWLDQIDEDFTALPAPAVLAIALGSLDATDLDAAPTASVRQLAAGTHRRRRMATLAAAMAIAAAGTGVAAASPGSLLYPVHQKLFGPVVPRPDPLDIASGLLDRVQGLTQAAGNKQHIRSDQATAAQNLLGQALGLLNSAPSSARRTALLNRQHSLAAEVNRLAVNGTRNEPGFQAPPGPTLGVTSNTGQRAGQKQPLTGDQKDLRTDTSAGAGDHADELGVTSSGATTDLTSPGGADVTTAPQGSQPSPSADSDQPDPN